MYHDVLVLWFELGFYWLGAYLNASQVSGMQEITNDTLIMKTEPISKTYEATNKKL